MVEEIKLCRKPPEEPLPEHLAQARLYAALWTLETGEERMEVRVVYVNDLGEPLRVFAEVVERTFLQLILETLLKPWLAFAVPERQRERLRNDSLRAMAFPVRSISRRAT